MKIYKYIFHNGVWFYIKDKNRMLGVGGSPIKIIRETLPEYVFQVSLTSNFLELLVIAGITKQMVKDALEMQEGSSARLQDRKLVHD